jgi:hypothetical protein
MKKVMWTLVAVAVLVCGTHMGVGLSSAEESLQPKPTVVVANPMVKIEKNAQLVIIGSGFNPGQELRILFKPLDGVFGDIGYALKPYPVPNKHGNWVTTWTCGRHLNKNIKESAYHLTVTTMEYDFLAQTPIAFYKEKPPEKKK